MLGYKIHNLFFLFLKFLLNLVLLLYQHKKAPKVCLLVISKLSSSRYNYPKDWLSSRSTWFVAQENSNTPLKTKSRGVCALEGCYFYSQGGVVDTPPRVTLFIHNQQTQKTNNLMVNWLMKLTNIFLSTLKGQLHEVHLNLNLVSFISFSVL